VFKAPALGARAVLRGRQYLRGLAAASETGVHRVPEMFRAELELAMALERCPTCSAITRSLVPTHH
jgi:isopentenyl diphosphate isomerase/L-lactate dehydrogenase-like FMN-dependent dehydrogenase